MSKSTEQNKGSKRPAWFTNKHLTPLVGDYLSNEELANMLMLINRHCYTSVCFNDILISRIVSNASLKYGSFVVNVIVALYPHSNRRLRIYGHELLSAVRNRMWIHTVPTIGQ